MDGKKDFEKRAKGKRRKGKEVREIQIDPEMIKKIKELMEKTGELPISAAPDPKEQDKKREDLLEELPNKIKEESLKNNKDKPKENSFSCCQSDSQKVSDPEYACLPEVIPTSEYIVCIYFFQIN